MSHRTPQLHQLASRTWLRLTLHDLLRRLTRYAWLAAAIAVAVCAGLWWGQVSGGWTIPFLGILAILAASLHTAYQRPTRLQALARLDAQEQTHELFSSAWAMRHEAMRHEAMRHDHQRDDQPWTRQLLALANHAASEKPRLNLPLPVRPLVGGAVALLLVAAGAQLAEPATDGRTSEKRTLTALNPADRTITAQADSSPKSSPTSSATPGDPAAESSMPGTGSTPADRQSTSGVPATGAGRSHEPDVAIAVPPADLSLSTPGAALPAPAAGHSTGEGSTARPGAAEGSAGAVQSPANPSIAPWQSSQWTSASQAALQTLGQIGTTRQRDLVKDYFSK